MSELSVVNTLLNSELKFPWKTKNEILCTSEVKVIYNRADIVYFELKKNKEIGFIAAVEAKLHDWKKAIQQAHRDKLFADRVYVALPKKFSAAAVSNISEFRNAAVGLIIIENDDPKVYFHPPVNNCRSHRHFKKVHESLKIISST